MIAAKSGPLSLALLAEGAGPPKAATAAGEAAARLRGHRGCPLSDYIWPRVEAASLRATDRAGYQR